MTSGRALLLVSAIMVSGIMVSGIMVSGMTGCAASPATETAPSPTETAPSPTETAPPPTQTAPSPIGTTHPSAAGDLAFRWSVSQGLWGTEVFEVRADGHGHYSFVPVAGGHDPRDYDVTVSAGDLDALAEAARRSSLCAETSSRLGIPDEGKPTLALWLPGATCEITLWDGEWYDRPGPSEVMHKIHALHARH